MTEAVGIEVWLLATLFGGAGAAVVQLIIQPVQNLLKNRKLKAHLRREMTFNINRLSQTINKLTELKEDYIKLDRQDTFFHYFEFKHSSVVFRAMINVGIIYDYLDDEQLLSFDNFVTGYSDVCADIVNEEIDKIKTKQYDKTEAANRTDFYIRRYTEHQNKLKQVREKI